MNALRVELLAAFADNRWTAPSRLRTRAGTSDLAHLDLKTLRGYDAILDATVADIVYLLPALAMKLLDQVHAGDCLVEGLDDWLIQYSRVPVMDATLASLTGAQRDLLGRVFLLALRTLPEEFESVSVLAGVLSDEPSLYQELDGRFWTIKGLEERRAWLALPESEQEAHRTAALKVIIEAANGEWNEGEAEE